MNKRRALYRRLSKGAEGFITGPLGTRRFQRAVSEKDVIIESRASPQLWGD